MNTFLVGYHINDLGEIEELMDHQGVGVEVRRRSNKYITAKQQLTDCQQFVSVGYWFLGWIFMHVDWCYPFFVCILSLF